MSSRASSPFGRGMVLGLDDIGSISVSLGGHRECDERLAQPEMSRCVVHLGEAESSGCKCSLNS